MYKRVNELLGTEYKSDSEISWGKISSKKLSESFIREFEDYVDWYWISKNQELSESFIREFQYKVNWYWISTNQTLSELFIKEFSSEVDWDNISSDQILSESFIREFQDKVNWDGISYSQLLSWNFMLEFEDRVNWDYISQYQLFINPNYERIDKYYLKCNKLYHLYQETKNRGWFLGYVNIKYNYFKTMLDTYGYFLRCKIYWKDLIAIDKSRYFEPIRQVKYV